MASWISMICTGGSVTGIYGQNGSGKTTVIDAIGILRALLSGNMLPDTAGDVVSASAGSATVTATFLIGDKQKPSYLEDRCPCARRIRIDAGARRRRIGAYRRRSLAFGP